MARLATALALCAGARAYVAPVAPKATVARGAFYGGGESGALDNLEGAPPGPVPNVANPGGAWDPLNLADTTPFGPTLEWYRAAELKHCRVAMAAFVGFLVAGSGATWPGNVAPGVSWKSCLGETPLDTWDNLPMYGKYQIIAWVGLMEVAGEMERPHYMTGGKGGTVFFDPPAKKLSLWDPLKSMKNWDDAKRKRGRLVELQNGRAAMFGMSSVSSLSHAGDALTYIPRRRHRLRHGLQVPGHGPGPEILPALRGRAPGRAVRGRLAHLGDGVAVGVVGVFAGKLMR